MSPLRFSTLILFGLLTAATAQDPGGNLGPRSRTRITPPDQTPAPAGVPTQQPAAPAPEGGTAPAPAPEPAGPIGQTKITEDINEPKLSGEALAGLYRKYTGKRIIVSSAASAAEFKFVQPATPQDPLTYDEASALLRKAAVLEGFVFVPDSQNPGIEVLTLATGGVNPKQVGIGIYNDNTPLPDGDAVISYVMTFNYLKPTEAVNIFNQVVGQFGAYGSVSAVPNAAAVIITENTSLIRKLIELKREIDVGSKSDSVFIPVKYSDVTELAETLNNLFNTQQQSQTTAGVNRAQQPVVQGGGIVIPGQTAQGGAAETPPVQIIPDARTNRLFVMGHPKDLTLVKTLVASFDVETSEKTFLRRKLRFLTVSDFLPVASDALSLAFSGTGDTGAQGGAGSSRPGGTAQQNNSRTTRNANSARSSGLGSSAFGNNNSSSFGDGSSSGGLGGGFSSSGGSLNAPNINSAPESVRVGRTLLVADNITNSIVVQGPPSGLEIVNRLLDQIDVKAPQVQISTVFGQLTLSDGLNTGLDWLKTFTPHGDGSGLAGSILGAGATILDPGAIVDFIPNSANATGFPPNAGLSLYGKIGTNYGAILNLLQTKDNFTVLARPSVTVTNNQKGTISSGRRIAVPTNSYSGGAANGTSTNIEYRDVVLKLEVVPLVNSNREVTLNLSLVSDDVIGNQTFQGIGQVPIIGTRELITTATIPNNETIILGGLITQNDRSTVTGIPILSSIPGLGRLFSTNTDSKERDELLIFLQPKIIMDGYDENRIQVDTDSRYRLAPKARTFSDSPANQPGVVVSDKAGGDTYIAPTSGRTILKPTLRPIHRR